MERSMGRSLIEEGDQMSPISIYSHTSYGNSLTKGYFDTVLSSDDYIDPESKTELLLKSGKDKQIQATSNLTNWWVMFLLIQSQPLPIGDVLGERNNTSSLAESMIS